MIICTHSQEETILFGQRLGQLLQKGEVISLIGEIGAGKTTLAKGIARGLGIDQPVRSPTFTLIHEYLSSPPFYHIDLYRLEELEQVASLALDEYYDNGITAIEWAEHAGELIPDERLEILISKPVNNERQIQLIAYGVSAQRILDKLRINDVATCD